LVWLTIGDTQVSLVIVVGHLSPAIKTLSFENSQKSVFGRTFRGPYGHGHEGIVCQEL
jgi:hypothetical protein